MTDACFGAHSCPCETKNAAEKAPCEHLSGKTAPNCSFDCHCDCQQSFFNHYIMVNIGKNCFKNIVSIVSNIDNIMPLDFHNQVFRPPIV